jgi:uncharacterized protein (UPF0333 family)
VKKINKKGQVMENLGGLAIGVVVLCIVLTVAFLIMAQGKSILPGIEGVACNSSNSASYACNATETLQESVQTIPGWVPIIIITGIGAVLISMVMMFRRAGG